jgi:CSLREA domain-containing protein
VSRRLNQSSRRFVFRHFSLLAVLLLAVATVLVFVARSRAVTVAVVWNLPAGGSWDSAGSWNPATVPNATGDSATFNGAATGSNPAQTASRTVTLDGDKTVGSIVLNTDLSNFNNTLAAGTGGTLVLDETGAGPATITTIGVGTGNNTISAPITLTDSLTAIVNNTAATSVNGSLNVTGAISGPVGITKQGNGTMTLATNTYLGGTRVNAGRLRLSSPTASLGSGNVNVAGGGLKIESGVSNAISDVAVVSLGGGGTAGVADTGFAELGAGINETVGTLVLGGVAKPAGTYGSTSSAGSFKSDEFFAGTGTLTVLSDAQSGPTLTVTTADDHNDGSCTIGDCSLREAINLANALAGANTISFDPSLTSGGAAIINLASVLPDLASDITISGPGANLLSVKRDSAAATRFRIFTVTSGVTVNISGLTITGGSTADGDAGTASVVATSAVDGGGILNNGTLAISNSTISGNRTGNGGYGASSSAPAGGMAAMAAVAEAS